MADQASSPQPPIFNLNAYSPAEIKEAVEKVGVKKTNLPFLASFMLAVIAGGSIGLGALYYTVVVSDAGLSFAVARVMGGVAFSLGLAIVLVGGAELFTGNNLIVMAWASGNVSTKNMLRNWVVVYFGNLIGALGLDEANTVRAMQAFLLALELRHEFPAQAYLVNPALDAVAERDWADINDKLERSAVARSMNRRDGK